MRTMVRVFGSVALALSVLAAPAVLAQDIEGSSDHPLVGRYEGSTITYYNQSEFDEAALLNAPLDYGALLEKNDTSDHSGEAWLQLEGRVTEIRYEGPEGRSSLEILRNYEAALKSKGFETVYSCADKKCFIGTLQDPYLMGEQLDPRNGLSTAYFDHARYVLGKADGAEGPVYAAVLVGEYQGVVTTFVKVVETKGMETDKIIFLDAGQMQEAIEASGSVSVYGILFDLDKDTLRPESDATLVEIAQLMANNPDLRLNVVGHTDNQGSAEYNQDLSERRAANVVAALTQGGGVAPERLTSSGAGLSSPVASNETEEGRARNRRVELVAQ